MRKLVYTLLTSDPGYADALPGGIQGDRASGVPDVLPFAVVRFSGDNPGMGRAGQTYCSVWVHGQKEDYTIIDDVLKWVRSVMEGATPMQHEGVWLTSVEWQGNSADLYDNERGTNTKSTTFLLTGSGL